MSQPDDHAVTQAFVPAAADDPGVTRTTGSATVHDAAPPPAVVPGYRLERELGRGGMGVVYLATQDGLNRQVALKMVLSGDHASATEKGRFLAEAEAVAAVRHPGVVQVFDFGTHDGRPFFALEFLSGGSLTDRLKGTPLPAKEAARLVEAIALAVQAAHDVGVIHRDLKPGNILFDADGTPKVTDFGLARKSDTQSGLTATGAILGTPSYMAPEQAEGRKDVGPAADVYAVGAILYECLTGRPPFRAATPLETIHQVLKDDPVPPSRFSPKLPRDIETVCLKCLSKDPRKRYPTAGAVADDLHRYLTGEPIVARPVSAAERGWRWVKRNPTVPAVVAVIALVIAAAVAAMIYETEKRYQLARDSSRRILAANLSLREEQKVAVAAKQEAERQRVLAHARLEKAVEAVDKMITRVNSERWAANPDLQDERRQVLEDAVAFFTGFTGQDSADSLVRTEAAKAYTRVAGAYLMLDALDKVKAAAANAARMYDGLMGEFPDDPEYRAAASEAHAILGSAAALSARYPDALREYARAVELADAARGMNPSSALYKLRAVEARSSLGYFYLQADRRKGEEVVGTLLGLARDVGGGPDAGYEYRVALGFALTVAAAYDQSSTTLGPQRLPSAEAKYAEAETVLAGTAGQSAPSARVWNQMAHTRAIIAVQRGFIATLRAATPEQKRTAAKQMEHGLKLLDDLLRPNPKAFPYRYQKYNALRALAAVYQSQGDAAAARAASAAADRQIGDMIRDNPHLEWLRVLDASQQANRLVARVREDPMFPFEAEADDLLALGRRANRLEVVYDVACVYSVASSNRPEAAERYAAKSMELLTGLIDTGYYRVGTRTPHLDQDVDLQPLRTRDDFKAFREAVNKANAATPAGKEVK